MLLILKTYYDMLLCEKALALILLFHKQIKQN